MDAQFGEAIHLIGYDLNPETVGPGEPVTLRFYWNATAPPASNYSLFLHLVPAGGDGTPLAQIDGEPAAPDWPTQMWTDPSETMISPSFTVALPADLPPGEYELRVGLYDYRTGDRLPVVGGGAIAEGNALRLTTFTLPPPG